MNIKLIAIGIGIVIAVGIGIFVLSLQQMSEQTETKSVAIKLGYLSIVDGVPIFSAIENGYFEKEGIILTTTKFATSNQLAEAVLNGDIDFGSIVSSSVILTIEEKAPNTFKTLAVVTHPVERPFSAILVRNDSSVSLEDLNGKKIGIFPGSTSLALSKIAFRNLLGDGFQAEYVQMPPNLWLESLSSGQVDAIISYEPFGTLGKETKVAKVLYDGLYEKHVMDNAPTAVSIVSAKFASENPDVVKKLQKALDEGHEFVKTNENQARQISVNYIPISDTVAQKMQIQDMYVGNEIDVSSLQKYADILFEAKELTNKIDASSLIFR